MKRNQSDNLPVAEIIECPVMGQQTIMEIDGRLKFARIGDKLYTQPSQAAQPEQPAVAAQAGQSEPVAWLVYAGILDKRPVYPAYETRHLAEHRASQIKSDTEVRPLYTHPAPVRPPLTEAQIDTICQRHWAAVRASPMETHRAFANPIDAYRAFARAIEAKINKPKL